VKGVRAAAQMPRMFSRAHSLASLRRKIIAGSSNRRPHAYATRAAS